MHGVCGCCGGMGITFRTLELIVNVTTPHNTSESSGRNQGSIMITSSSSMILVRASERMSCTVLIWKSMKKAVSSPRDSCTNLSAVRVITQLALLASEDRPHISQATPNALFSFHGLILVEPRNWKRAVATNDTSGWLPGSKAATFPIAFAASEAALVTAVFAVLRSPSSDKILWSASSDPSCEATAPMNARMGSAQSSTSLQRAICLCRPLELLTFSITSRWSCKANPTVTTKVTQMKSQPPFTSNSRKPAIERNALIISQPS